MKIAENRTKILATYGPACADYNIMKDMVQAGVDVFRFNFSHGDHEFHRNGFKMVQKINDTYGLNIGILADLQGPKIRVGDVEGTVNLEIGKEVILTNEEVQSSSERIFVNYDKLPMEVKKDERILMDDGKITLRVMETDGKKNVRCKIVDGGPLTSRKGVNIPDSDISIKSLSEKDIADLEFAVKAGANWIALSFVRKAEDVSDLKELIGRKKDYLKVIAKIEKPEALKDIDHIIDAADGIMVARGDLGVEVPIERMPLIQKDIVNRCIQKAKPVVIATQMMESMIENSTPTRPEVTDVANAVIDGADAVMLSGETSVGKYPVKVIQTMERILANVEKSELIYNKNLVANRKSPSFISDTICYNSCKIATDLGAKAIIGMTKSGYTGFMVSSYRPKAKIFIFTDNKRLLNTLNLCWGVKAFTYDRFVSTDVTIRDVIKILKKEKMVKRGDIVVNSASMPLREQGRTNMVKVTVVK
jgi:pyruvate kinase